jgi:protein-S-isoprenylcysteine O-methyltransferase Ste14
MKKLLIPPVFVLISVILIIVFYFLLPGLNIIPFPFNFLGLFIAFPGFIIMGKAYDLFKKYNTTLGIEESTFLIEEGVFGKSRNPMYAGMFLLLLGIGVCFGNMVSVCISFVFIILIMIVLIPAEEKMMENIFGEKYIDYKKRTGMWI